MIWSLFPSGMRWMMAFLIVSTSSKRIPVSLLGSGPNDLAAATGNDIDVAVGVAKEAFGSTWRYILQAEKGRVLGRLADLIERDAEELGSIEAVDAGILFAESKNLHIVQAVETLRCFAGRADKITGQHIQIPQGYTYTRREALGVCAAIVPWNSPLYVSSTKLPTLI